VTERDVARVETSLGVKLPAHYRRFLVEGGANIAKARRGGAFVPYFTTAKEIIAANAGIRADPNRQPTNHDREPWPLKYLIVGTDGGGDYWCVDLTAKKETVWRFDSEAGGVFRPADQPTWAAVLAEVRSPKPAAAPAERRFYHCKRGDPAAGSDGDGSFAVTDVKGRGWLCYELREPTPEEILARVRGLVRTPDWLADRKGLREIEASGPDELRERLGRER
jgi:hypothetical protein